MNVVIMGGGRVGLNLSFFLVSDGHDITLIESSEEKCQEIAPELDATVICGSGTDINILEECNIEDADVFVAATGHDEPNLLACILAKEFNVPKIISRVSDPNHREAFCNVGINTVINPELTAASYVERLIIKPKIADLAVLGKGDAELLDFTLEKGEFVGKKIGDISPTDDYIIVAMYSNGDIIIPTPDMILNKGVKISVLIKTKFIKNVLKRFTKDLNVPETSTYYSIFSDNKYLNKS
jgi:trk system potassium uptake protein TrkA